MKALAADSIQAAIRAEGLDGWLFYSFRGSDPIAENILRLDNARLSTRRWFYFVPAAGSPRKIVHAIESETLDSLPGEKMLPSLATASSASSRRSRNCTADRNAVLASECHSIYFQG